MSTLYFAYDATLDPEVIVKMAPGARFLFTAHYPETRLDFVPSVVGEPRPTLTRDPSHTVWGAVFEIPESEVDTLVEAVLEEGRAPGFDHKAVDREGNKYACLTFVSETPANGAHRPTTEYLDAMIRGARHWKLPAGWVMGLEDLAEGPLLA
ncbi:MAG: gamma-glutamylcyclotransferase [Actinobacteria bacterium]|nr:gamma-glutamylcyclotransferase [Actinomycetota bacterium]MCI0544736.1 gamma-glutamylcyclotransferase [Actinomycetota bacterium]MCI0677493.1 gamma-glutamylcyclotransferase [Actinomycetota bacterium]